MSWLPEDAETIDKVLFVFVILFALYLVGQVIRWLV